MLRDLLRDAVQRHVGPDTGVLLSGGIDSATVAHFAPDLPLFTGYYRGEAYDERPWARLMAEGRQWHEIEITPDDFITHFDSMLAAIEPPYAGPGTFGQWMVARYVSTYVSRALSGEGGDELFGGYARLHLVAGIQPPDGYGDYVLPEGYPKTLSDALDWEWKVNLPALLRVDEQVTAAHDLKAIAPMTDYRVVNFVLGRPDKERVGKVMLKDAMEGLIPPEILHRTDKRGFPVPFVEWAHGPLQEFFMDRLGYLPDPSKPWDRKYWYDLCAGQTALV
jgi:asparagine synthetase B (glutamine-hydrolysing)